MWVSRYFFLFILYSVLGWVYETAFRTVKNGKWENRGFLYGPLCPIYGAGALLICLLNGLLARVFGAPPVWAVFLAAFLGSAVLEFLTSWVLEKLFHAVWWDYSRLPLNIQGRVSFFTSCGFGLAGLLLVYAVGPFAESVADAVPPAAMEALSLLLMGVLAVDFTLTVTALTHFAETVRELEGSLNDRMDGLVESAHRKTADAKKRILEEKDLLGERLGAVREIYRPALRRVRAFRFPRLENEKLEQLLRRSGKPPRDGGGRDGERE